VKTSTPQTATLAEAARALDKALAHQAECRAVLREANQRVRGALEHVAQASRLMTRRQEAK
jgi:hypothetical protein